MSPPRAVITQVMRAATFMVASLVCTGRPTGRSLVAAGLLRACTQVPAEGPPRVGRRPKVYEPSDLELQITIPERRYALVGELLVDAIAQATPGERPPDAANRLARTMGMELGAHVRQA
jgi:hypothetical protein